MLGGSTGGDDLDQLEHALTEVRAVPLSCLSAVEVAERACRLRRLVSQLDAIEAATLAAADGHADGPVGFADLGYRHATEYVTAKTGACARTVRRTAKIGCWLSGFPVFAEAFADGVMTRRHVNELMTLDTPRTHQSLVDAQEMLVEAARACDFRGFVTACGYWLNAADSDGTEPVEQHTRNRCSYQVHTDGSVSGRFWFDPFTGQAFRTAIDTETQRLFRTDTETGVTRASGHRHASALVGLITAGADTTQRPSVTPLINIVIGHDLAEGLLRRATGDTTVDVAPDRDDVNRRCELIDGTPLHPQHALTAMTVGAFQRIVLDTSSRPVDVAVKARCFTPWMKHALLVAARGRCQIPGCDAPLPWLQAACGR